MLIVDVKWGEGEKARTEGVERSGGQYRGTDCINISSTDTTLLDHAYKSLFVNVFRKTKRNYIRRFGIWQTNAFRPSVNTNKCCE